MELKARRNNQHVNTKRKGVSDFMKIIKIIRESTKGLSIQRIFYIHELKAQHISGKILDLGGGKRTNYYDFLNNMPDSKIITVNISLNLNPDIIMDVEHQFPLKDNYFDHVLLFYVLEHIYNYKNVLKYTVLRKYILWDILSYVKSNYKSLF